MPYRQRLPLKECRPSSIAFCELRAGHLQRVILNSSRIGSVIISNMYKFILIGKLRNQRMRLAPVPIRLGRTWFSAPKNTHLQRRLEDASSLMS